MNARPQKSLHLDDDYLKILMMREVPTSVRQGKLMQDMYNQNQFKDAHM